MIKRSILIVAGLFIVIASANAKDLGTFGRTYPIAEKDALTEIEERARQVNWEKVLDKRKLENFQGPPDKATLPRAQRGQVRQVDMTYTAEIDVPDGKGGILYPKGYTFNPLDFITYPKTIIVINGNDKDQVSWFKDSEYSQQMDVTLMITEGAFGVITKKVNRTIFYATTKIINRFQLAAVPSIIKQKGQYLEVTEVVPTLSRKVKK